MDTNNEKPLSALEKARLAKKGLEDKKAQELELAKQQEAEKFQNIHGSIGDLQGKLKDLETQKELLTQQESAYKKTRKESIGSVRGAIKELAGSEDTKEILADENTKQEILGEDVEKVAEAKQKQKEAKAAIKEIEKQIAETAEQIVGLEKETPEFKEAETKRLAEEQEKQKTEVASKLLFGNNIKIVDIESGKSSNMIGPLDRGNYSKLSSEEKAIAAEAVTTKVHQDIEKNFDARLSNLGVKGAQEDLERIKKYNKERYGAQQELRNFIYKRREIADKIKKIYAAVEEKAKTGDKNSIRIEKVMHNQELYKSPDSLLGGAYSINEEKLKKIFDSFNDEAKPGAYLYSPEDIKTYVEQALENSEKGLVLLEKAVSQGSDERTLSKEDGQAFDGVLKMRKDLNQKAISGSELGRIIEKQGSLSKAESVIKETVQKNEEQKKNMLELADVEVSMQMMNLETPNGVGEAQSQLQTLEREKKNATEALNFVSLLEAQNSNRLDAEIVIEKGNRGGTSIGFTESIKANEESVKELKKLEPEKGAIIAELDQLKRVGYAENLLQRMSKKPKDQYDNELTEINKRLDAKEQEIQQARDKSAKSSNDMWLKNDEKLKSYLEKVNGNPKTLRELLTVLKQEIEPQANQKPDETKVELVKKWNSLSKTKDSLISKISAKK